MFPPVNGNFIFKGNMSSPDLSLDQVFWGIALVMSDSQNLPNKEVMRSPWKENFNMSITNKWFSVGCT